MRRKYFQVIRYRLNDNKFLSDYPKQEAGLVNPFGGGLREVCDFIIVFTCIILAIIIIIIIIIEIIDASYQYSIL